MSIAILVHNDVRPSGMEEERICLPQTLKCVLSLSLSPSLFHSLSPSLTLSLSFCFVPRRPLAALVSHGRWAAEISVGILHIAASSECCCHLGRGIVGCRIVLLLPQCTSENLFVKLNASSSSSYSNPALLSGNL
jgi:hypothetical protein